ncbi:MAG: NADH-quinone oxidoreductase subunit M [Bacteroidetes bacterium]|nr:NADH-quinone oxidoreductase subunit M [Bacteroidota bacterium]MBL0019177.1 NADH-quinone oxidoreductase subunit M [Bacteroidota bacterium]MBP6640897.1 NADH-quinone oxidoreductase subunit M [Bacteroidia bacterium]
MSADTANLLMNLMIVSPMIGVPLVLLMGNKQAKVTALLASCVPLVLSILVYIYYLDNSGLATADVGGNPNSTLNNYVLFSIGDWWFNIPGLDIKFMTGIDGISIYLVLLTTILFPLTIFFSWGSVDKMEKGYYALLLVLQVGVLGFFCSLDMVLFYIFFEMVLIPMYFLIGIWGGKERIYASIKFFLYTLVGSLLMLVAIIWVAIEAAPMAQLLYPDAPSILFTTDYHAILNANIPLGAQTWLFAAFALAFAIKVPLFPLHTWLPDAHTQAPTAGSVILAGVLLKMGTYGLVRFCLPFFPEASVDFAPLMCFLAVVGIIYGGMAAMVQTDVKRLVAYSSVSHLGFIVLGIFSFTPEALNGAVLQMVSHGITTGALFLMVGMIYDRRHTRMIADFQGLARQIPIFTLFFMITVLASVGLPGLNGFVGEFMILAGSFASNLVSDWWAVIAASGVIVAAVYLLWMFRRVMFGALDKEENRKVTDLTRNEIWVMIPLVLLMFYMGFNAGPFLKQIDNSSVVILKHIPGAGSTVRHSSGDATTAPTPVAENAH